VQGKAPNLARLASTSLPATVLSKKAYSGEKVSFGSLLSAGGPFRSNCEVRDMINANLPRQETQGLNINEGALIQ
jgi:hypothetical protein